jgi:2-polyprenyl-3-methyl-5-hydroxy-6-metoxy-1,4-benzoquinol methylase
LLKRVLGANQANPDLHAQVMRRFSGIPAFERWFIEGRAQLCPFWLIDALTPREGRIFDCGSGHGYLACYCALSSAQRRIASADPDAAKTAMAQHAAEGLPAEFHACAAEDLLTRDERIYDGAMVIDMLYQLPRERQESLVRQLARRTRPGGVVVIKETHRYAGLRYAFAYAEECLVVSLRRRRPSLRFYYRSVKEWRSLMERNGFAASAVLPVPGEAMNNRSYIMAFVKAGGPG